MIYVHKIMKRAQKFIASQDALQQARILKAIYALPLTGDIKKLQGKSDLYRLRVGNYRIIFKTSQTEKDDQKITIVCVTDADNRGQIYK